MTFSSSAMQGKANEARIDMMSSSDNMIFFIPEHPPKIF
jgi:hypothetical protein